MDFFIQTQIQQTWFRMLFGVAGLLYIWSHCDFSGQYGTLFLSTVALYFIYNTLTLLTIKRSPLSAFRMLFSPLLDVWAVGIGMLMDGGQTSALYLILLIIIFGNALRFGSIMLIYSQTLSIIGIISISLATLFGLQLTLDGTLLFMQIAALIVMPAYVLQIKKQTNVALQARQDAEDATFGLLDHGPLPAFTFHLDDQGNPRILYANLAMKQIYRNSADKLIGEQVDVLALMEDGDEVSRACMFVFSDKKKNEPYRFYIRGKNPDGNILQFMGQSMRLYWHGRWVGVCFLMDITESEAARNELEKSIHNSYMSTLVVGVVHDFRNILTSIIGTAEVMSFAAKDNESKRQLELIMEAGERGSAMTSHLLTLGKVEHKQQIETPTTEVIHQSLSSIIGLLRIQLPPRIQLHLDVQDELPPISTSITEIEEIVSNLINNSVYAISKAGHIRVTLSSSREEKLRSEEKTALCIHVHDNGHGIPKKYIGEVTRAFWTSRKAKGGTGLGLAIVKRIVRDNDGLMEIQSDVGKGTDIYVYLPVKRSSNRDNSREKTAPDPTIELTPDPCTILLVDDNSEVLFVHKALLEKMGHRVLTETDGKAGLRKFEQHTESIEMIVTDFKMPEMDGLEFSIAIREQKPDISILMITAYGDTERLQQADELGIHILSKPVTYKKLANTIAMLQGKD